MTKFFNKYFYIIIPTLIVAVDQGAKILVRLNFDLFQSVRVIPRVFYLTYFGNPGAGMGIPIPRWWLVALTVFIIAGFIYYIARRKPACMWFKTSIAFILGGAFGNLIDRAVTGYVVDFLDFSQIGFPFIFNIADIFVVVGAVILMICVIREKKDEKSEKDGA
ncbi:MAG: signal peptidase II [Oscillospiraceae bacterium]|nr:signal peptidase II [Oscillospiraceae bacterium]